MDALLKGLRFCSHYHIGSLFSMFFFFFFFMTSIVFLVFFVQLTVHKTQGNNFKFFSKTIFENMENNFQKHWEQFSNIFFSAPPLVHPCKVHITTPLSSFTTIIVVNLFSPLEKEKGKKVNRVWFYFVVWMYCLRVWGFTVAITKKVVIF